MLDQAAIQNNFVGRDGFRWWIGQIPPYESMAEQLGNKGWGNRFKVRIMGYHPASEAELSNEDLPWAQVLLPPTAGSGAANAMTSVQIQPGDIVFGFFLDGDNAQIPIIQSVFGRTDLSSSAEYSSPFTPFTGFSQAIPKNNKLPVTQPGDNITTESNEPKVTSNPTPPSVSQDQAAKISEKTGVQTPPVNAATGTKIPLANTTKNSMIDKISSTIENLINKLKRLNGNITQMRYAISNAIDAVTISANGIIGQLFDTLINGNDGGFIGMIGLLKEGLDLLYKLVFAKVLAATGNPIAAHLAGVSAQQVMVTPVKLLEEAFHCVVGQVVSAATSVIADLVDSTLGNVERFVTCAGEQFAGSLINSIIGLCENFLNGPLGAITKLLQFFGDFNVGNILRDAIGLLSEGAIGFSCNQNFDSYKGLINEWVVGRGPSGSPSTINESMAGTFREIRNIANKVNNAEAELGECFSGLRDFASPPVINIFGGGGGRGASAVPVFGNLTEGPGGQVTASVVGVQLTNRGSGYVYPPFIEIVDDQNQGFGAVARCTIDEKGQVEGVYMVSVGEFYSVGDVLDYSIVDVIVEDGGSGYDNSLVITDDQDNPYDYVIEGGRITQVTPLNNTADGLPVLSLNGGNGIGAILRPILGSVNSDNFEEDGDGNLTSDLTNLFAGKPIESIDCPE